MLHFLVRLACVRHAASVDSEPGSNSRLKPECHPTGSQGDRYTANNPDSRRDGIHRTALTYFVRSLGLESSFHLTTGTFNLVVKDRLRIPPERLVFDFRPSGPDGRLVLETCCPLCRQALETNLSNLPRVAALCQPCRLTLLVRPRLSRLPGPTRAGGQWLKARFRGTRLPLSLAQDATEEAKNLIKKIALRFA